MGVTFSAISDRFGAHVAGVSGADTSEPEIADQIKAALDRHGVLVFSELFIDDDDLVALSRLLGDIVELPHGAIEGHPEIMPVSRDPSVSRFAEIHTANDFWHTDGTSYERPDKATLLTARQAPDEGEGDTEFASTYAAYDALSDEDKERLGQLRVRHTFANAQRNIYPEPTERQEAQWSKVPGREHPLVWRRRDGRSSLLIGSTAESIVGMPQDEGRALLDWLNEWATQPEFTIAHRWREGDLVIFDNTGLMHRSRPYRATSTRLMHRTTLAGDEAVE